MDYIRREDAIDCVLSQYCASSDETEEALGDAIEEIKKRPAADVVERKNGKWIEVNIKGLDYVYCSECEDSYYPTPIDPSWYFCPHCGAKMEG